MMRRVFDACICVKRKQNHHVFVSFDTVYFTLTLLCYVHSTHTKNGMKNNLNNHSYIEILTY